jgi:hypothetical protein
MNKEKLIKSQKLLILELLIYSFENENLMRYGAIGFYITAYPDISENDILEKLNKYLNNAEEFERELLVKLKSLNEIKILKAKTETKSLINSIGRYMDLPGEKNNIIYRLSSI